MYVCMYVWLCWVFVSVRGLSPVVASGGHSSLWCRGHSSSRCAGLSLSWPLVAEHRLQTRRLSNCGSRAELLHGTWDLPRPGLKPVSPELAGRFSTTAPPGKPPFVYFALISFALGDSSKKNIATVDVQACSPYDFFLGDLGFPVLNLGF